MVAASQFIQGYVPFSLASSHRWVGLRKSRRLETVFSAWLFVRKRQKESQKTDPREVAHGVCLLEKFS
ncbi:hypothetical protein BAG01nite_24960 [Brevibacillus agri]|uniref:Uncharacterized protein n=1 Tax=Brevibacillus agri TaxID=51101 RepID=A0A3M8AWG6_9BACL|nr:hypothetical protein BA6348_04940 [Brevibacillus agri]RNB55554.1 hypothetical protein EB820_10990 [Brevibacillus agri]GED26394.1 hypothetical protein BAG01nite_24960 [Brevibacillus agri]